MTLVGIIEAIKKTGMALTLSVEDEVAVEVKVTGKTVNVNVKKPELLGKVIKKSGLA